MCGIVGYITTQNELYENSRRGFFKYALMLDTLRGPDSTGVITVSKKFTVNRYKTIASGFRMATSDQFDQHVPNGWCAIGHNRAATIGEVNVANAHPFKFGKVSLVHNGTLTKSGASLPTYDKKLDVDSMQIAKALSSVPPKEAKDMLKHIEGDFAIVWADERDRSVNMARNRGRPLHIGFNHDRTFMCFMSDADHLQVLTKSLTGTTAHIPTIYSVDTYQLLKWKRGNLRPEVVGFDPFVRKSITTTRPPHGQIGFPMSKEHATPKNTGTSHSTSSRLSKKQRKKLLKLANKRKTAVGAGDTTTKAVPGSGITINNLVSAYEGVVPKKNTAGMLESLETFFNVNSHQVTAFKPEEFYELTPNLYQVVGTVIAEGWGKVDWEGCINFVNKAQADAYASKRWLVRAIGLTRNRSVPGCPAVLCDLVHTDYAKYEQSVEEAKAKAEAEKKEADDIVQDVSGKLINRTQLEKKMEDGCINCHAPLFVEEAFAYETVNNDRDILCEQCKWDMQWPLAD